MAALSLKLRAKCTIHSNRTFVHLFSSSSSNGGDDSQDPPPSQSPPPPSSSSHFNDVKASLKQPPPPNPRRLFQSPPPNPPSFSQSNATKFRSLEEIRKNLSQFRSTTAPQPVSFQEIYKRNVLGKGGEGVGSGEPAKIASFDKIRESLMNLRITQNPNQNDRSRGGADGMNNKVMDPLSLKSFKESLQMKPDSKFVRSSSVQTPPPASFGKDLRGKSQPSKNYLLRAYKYEELGERLRKLRPTDAKIGKNWFSLSELNQRLQKLREIEEKESVSSIGGVTFADLRSSLSTLQHDADEKTKRSSLQRLDMLSHLGGTPSYMLSPPKGQLVEKFFHPDNMSSAEKLKLELIKVRDEFKMSESDCGSSRVQVAQLTTKIKHLSSVLHKKDKHSRKGLQEMVQRRKKLLRYLRRTDWDSYCLCLSKLGLRDNPDYKN